MVLKSLIGSSGSSCLINFSTVSAMTLAENGVRMTIWNLSESV